MRTTTSPRLLSAFVVLSISVLSAGCDAEHTTPPITRDNREFSPEFAGDWSGTATLYVGTQSQGARPVDVNVRVEVDGSRLDVVVTPVCGSKPIEMRAEGNGRSTMWYGDTTCPAVTDGCRDLSIKYTSAILKVLEDGRFYALLNGTAAGCGVTTDAQVEVYAMK